MKKARGFFSTLELIVGVGIVAVLMAVAIPFWSKMKVEANYRKMVAQYADDLHTLQNVAIKYFKENKADLIASPPKLTFLSAEDLITKGYLPAGWGSYDGNLGRSYLRAAYYVGFRSDDNDPSLVRMIITDGFDYDWAITQKLGVTTTGDHLEPGTLKITGDIADYAAEHYQMKMGIQQPNQKTVTMRGNGAQLDMSDWLTVLNRAAPVAFIGWPELGQDRPVSPEEGGYTKCRLSSGTSCAAGWTPVVGMNLCGFGSESDPNYPPPPASLDWMDTTYYSVPNTNFVFNKGMRQEDLGMIKVTCPNHPQRGCTGNETKTFGRVFVNGLQQPETLCSHTKPTCVSNTYCSTVSNRSNSTWNRTWCCQ